MEERFGANMRVLRKKMKYSINNMSDLMGIGTTMVSNYERGASEPNLSILTKVAEIFGLSVEDLIYCSEIDILTKFENKNNSSSSNNHNIISNPTNNRDIIQNQGTYNSKGKANEKDFSPEVEMLRQENQFLKKENDLLRNQLERVNKTVDMLLEKK